MLLATTSLRLTDNTSPLHDWLSDVLFFFFFSSRRRHTRFDCDWSSDVCSSDLRLVWLPPAVKLEVAAPLQTASTTRPPEGTVMLAEIVLAELLLLIAAEVGAPDRKSVV